MEAVNGPRGRGIAIGGIDMTFAKAAITATKAMVFVFILFTKPLCYELEAL